MPLTPGTRISSYEVVALLGAGGMGEVYRARDVRLGRDVAIKVLPDEFAGDQDRLLRFEREARTLASLNHTRIAQIHGLEEVAAKRFLVMELVEGEDLSERIVRGPIPVDDALNIASQIADALAAAHDQGIIHRDLKPANIKLRSDGSIKVLDFGLAKSGAAGAQAVSSALAAPGVSGAVTSPAQTMQGVILGTAAYMSPEQARGRPVDKRADIWALGCVLYEMLTGTRAFQGDTATDVIAAVVKSEPAWERLPPDLPPRVRTMLERCLRKDPAGRLRDAGDLKLELNARDESAPAASLRPAPMARGRRSLALLAISGLLVATAALAAYTTWNDSAETSAESPPVHLSMTFPEASRMHLGQPVPSLALSPDGRTVIYTAGGGPEGNQLWMRSLDSFTAIPLAGTRNGRAAFFSPDGRWIAFFAEGQIKKVPATSGPPVVVCDYQGGGTGGTWTTKDEIVFTSLSDGQRMWRVPAAGGTPTLVTEETVFDPDALPGGDTVIATLENLSAETAGDHAIAAVDLQTGRVTRLVNGGTYPRYVTSGHLVFLRNNALVASRFDPRSLTVGDSPKTVIEPVFMEPATPGGNFAVSASGTLAYAPGDATYFQRRLVTIADGAAQPVLDERRYFENPRTSPDGRRIAVMVRSARDRVWAIDTARGTMSRVTTTDWQQEGHQVFSRDGRWLALATVKGSSWSKGRQPQIVLVASDGNRTEQPLTMSETLQVPNSFTPDGKSLVFHENADSGTGADLYIVDLDGQRAVHPLLKTPFNEWFADVSPDGRRIAYVSNRSGRAEVWLARFPAMTDAVQVSINGGMHPRWGHDGRRLYFYRANTIWSADIAAGASLAISQPALVTELPTVRPSGTFDVMPDGRILFVDGRDVGGTPELRLVLNWTSELRRLLPAP
jgi:serine/threonine protein kinase/Tol biopolymer transport system component